MSVVRSLVRPAVRLTIASAAALSLLAGAPAKAGLFDDDEARKAIIDLRNKSDANQRDIASQLELQRRNQADVTNQIDGLRQEIARLRGQIESLANDLANEQKRNKDFYVDLDGRLRKVEPQQATVDGQTATVDPNEAKSYEAALAQFKTSDFKGSIASLQTFLARYPSSAYAPAAQYWIGTGYYAQRDYKAAIAAQQVVLRNYPTSPRAADALLNVASSQADLGDRKAARVDAGVADREVPRCAGGRDRARPAAHRPLSAARLTGGPSLPIIALLWVVSSVGRAADF